MADSPASASSLGTAGAGGTVTVPAPSSGGDSKTGTGSGNARPTITTTPIRQRAWWERVAQFILVFQIGNLFSLFVAFGLFWYAVFWYLDITIPRWILIVGAVAYLGHMSMADTHLKGGREWEAFRRGFRVCLVCHVYGVVWCDGIVLCCVVLCCVVLCCVVLCGVSFLSLSCNVSYSLFPSLSLPLSPPQTNQTTKNQQHRLIIIGLI